MPNFAMCYVNSSIKFSQTLFFASSWLKIIFLISGLKFGEFWFSQFPKSCQNLLLYVIWITIKMSDKATVNGWLILLFISFHVKFSYMVFAFFQNKMYKLNRYCVKASYMVLDLPQASKKKSSCPIKNLSQEKKNVHMKTNVFLLLKNRFLWKTMSLVCILKTMNM